MSDLIKSYCEVADRNFVDRAVKYTAKPFWFDLSYPLEEAALLFFILMRQFDINHKELKEKTEQLDRKMREMTKMEQESNFVKSVEIKASPTRDRYEQTGVMVDYKIVMRSLGEEEDTHFDFFFKVTKMTTNQLRAIAVSIREFYLQRLSLNHNLNNSLLWHYRRHGKEDWHDERLFFLDRELINLFCSGGTIICNRTTISLQPRNSDTPTEEWKVYLPNPHST